MNTTPIRSLGIIVLAALAAASCGKDTTVGPPVVAAVIVTPGADTLLALGRTRQFTAVAQDANGNPVSGVTLVWHSSNPAVATVDSATGIVTAVGNGLSVIRADAGGVIGQATLAVVQVVASVAVTPGTASFTAVGDTQRFVAVAKDSGGASVQGVRFLWGSSNGNAATVDTLGLATGRGPGQAIISATGRGVPGYSVLTVAQAGLHLVVTSAPATAAAGQVFPVALQVELRDSSEHVATGARDAVTIAVAAGAAHTAGTVTVGAVGGVATFTALWLEGPVGSYQLQATASGVGAATSTAITLGPGSPAAITLSGQPASGLVGDAITIPTASLYDRWGNLATTATDSVTLLVAQSHWGTQLRGPTKVVPAAGVATFGPVVADRPGAATLAASIFGAVTSPSNQFQQRLDSARSVSAAASGTCAIYRKGAFCWGDNSYGQLGDGTLRPDSVPVLVRTALSFTSIAAGTATTCALTAAGAAYCWGFGSFGTLGRGGAVNDSLPGPVSGGLTFAQLALNDDVSCGVTTGNAAYCWGYSVYGDLGGGQLSGTKAYTPAAVAGGHAFVNLSAAGGSVCAVATDSLGYCWGHNNVSQLGNGGTANDSVPTAVAGGHKFLSIAAGPDHGCGVAADSTAWCWGANTYGQLGNGGFAAASVPVAVSGGLHFRALVAGQQFTCGLSGAFAVYCWGANLFGVLGAARAEFRDSVPLFANVSGTRIGGAGYHMCAVDINSVLNCWGDNQSFELGDGTRSSRNVATFVVTTAPPLPLPAVRPR